MQYNTFFSSLIGIILSTENIHGHFNCVWSNWVVSKPCEVMNYHVPNSCLQELSRSCTHSSGLERKVKYCGRKPWKCYMPGERNTLKLNRCTCLSPSTPKYNGLGASCPNEFQSIWGDWSPWMVNNTTQCPHSWVRKRSCNPPKITFPLQNCQTCLPQGNNVEKIVKECPLFTKRGFIFLITILVVCSLVLIGVFIRVRYIIAAARKNATNKAHGNEEKMTSTLYNPSAPVEQSTMIFSLTSCNDPPSYDLAISCPTKTDAHQLSLPTENPQMEKEVNATDIKMTLPIMNM